MEDETPNVNYEKVTTKKSNSGMLVKGLVAAIVVAAFLGGYSLGLNGENSISNDELAEMILEMQEESPVQAQQARQAQPNAPVFVSLDDDPLKGNPNAPFTIVEFSDFQCPFCMKFHAETLPLIEQNYINTGKVNFVYRDFPIQSIHPNAIPAALASECADEQGKFWEFHDMIFVNQKAWERQDVVQSIQTFQQYAVELNLDIESFNDCLSSGKYVDEINKDLQDGRDYGVTGTPGFFVGNEKMGFIKIQGAQPYAAFQQVLDKMGA